MVVKEIAGSMAAIEESSVSINGTFERKDPPIYLYITFFVISYKRYKSNIAI